MEVTLLLLSLLPSHFIEATKRKNDVSATAGAATSRDHDEATQVSGHSAPCHADPPLAPDRPSAGHVPKPEPAHAASLLEIRGGKAWT